MKHPALEALDIEIDALERALAEARDDAERERLRSAATELQRRIDGMCDGVRQRIHQLDERQRQMIREHPRLAVEYPRRAAQLGVFAKRHVRASRGASLAHARERRSTRPRRQRTHTARATSSTDPGDSDADGLPPGPAEGVGR
jgi:hypothetical protein